MSLLEKIRKAREIQVEVNGHTYTVCRPTDMDMAEIAGRGSAPVKELLRRFVIGWDLKEIDLIPGGNPVAVPFDADLLAEFMADRPDDWADLVKAIKDGYADHVARREAAAKN